MESQQNIVGCQAFHSEMGLTQLPPVPRTFRCLGQKSENVFEKSNILIGKLGLFYHVQGRQNFS